MLCIAKGLKVEIKIISIGNVLAVHDAAERTAPSGRLITQHVEGVVHRAQMETMPRAESLPRVREERGEV